jgi:hypothetical protein
VIQAVTPGGFVTDTVGTPSKDVDFLAGKGAANIAGGIVEIVTGGGAAAAGLAAELPSAGTSTLVVAGGVTAVVEGAANVAVGANAIAVAIKGGTGAGSSLPPKEVAISRTRSPEAAKHLEETGQTGRELTVDRAGAAARRKGNMEGVKTKPGLDRDESPPAVFAESEGGSVRHVPSGDNRSAGGQLGSQLKGVPNGAKVVIRTTD